jgi:hypothetical protein
MGGRFGSGPISAYLNQSLSQVLSVSCRSAGRIRWRWPPSQRQPIRDFDQPMWLGAESSGGSSCSTAGRAWRHGPVLPLRRVLRDQGAKVELECGAAEGALEGLAGVERVIAGARSCHRSTITRRSSACRWPRHVARVDSATGRLSRCRRPHPRACRPGRPARRDGRPRLGLVWSGNRSTSATLGDRSRPPGSFAPTQGAESLLRL